MICSTWSESSPLVRGRCVIHVEVPLTSTAEVLDDFIAFGLFSCGYLFFVTSARSRWPRLHGSVAPDGCSLLPPGTPCGWLKDRKAPAGSYSALSAKRRDGTCVRPRDLSGLHCNLYTTFPQGFQNLLKKLWNSSENILYCLLWRIKVLTECGADHQAFDLHKFPQGGSENTVPKGSGIFKRGSEEVPEPL